MKKLLITAVLVPILMLSNAQEVEVSSEIEAVTVFLSGAQITRNATVSVGSGTTELVFTNLSYYIQPASVQVQGSDDFTIISVKHAYNYTNERAELPEVAELKNQLESSQKELRLLTGTETVYNYEKNMILTNKSIGGSQAGFDVETVIDLADLYEGRLKEIEFKLIEIANEKTELNEEINELSRQINELSGHGNTYTSEVHVNISTGSTKKVNVVFDYVVTHAGWAPLYDVRSSEIGQPVTLTYKGNVWQNTGYDWSEVDIKLSTGNPTQSGTKPTVYPWVVSVYEPMDYERGRGDYMGVSGEIYYDMPATTESMDDMDYDKAEDNYWENETTSLADFVTITQSAVNTTFNIALPYTIPSDGNAYAVEVQDYEVPASYSYFAAPKFDCDAFLLAQITDWDQLNLLPGNANIFYEGTYVGQAYLNTNITSDTLDISMGRDKGVVVERIKIKDYEAPQTIGTKRKLTIAIEINVRNNKNTAIELNLEDQIPISSNKDIEVAIVDDAGATIETSTGKLSWFVSLDKGESQSYRFTYTIKYPKNQELSTY